VTVEEDDEKFTFINDPCGSGGRMMRAGRFDGNGKFARVKKAQPQTFNRENLPVYCAHCAVWNGIMTVKWYGRIHWAVQPPENPEDPCLMYMYKDRKSVPEKFYKGIGITDSQIKR
jgi:hypothetical protein